MQAVFGDLVLTERGEDLGLFLQPGQLEPSVGPQKKRVDTAYPAIDGDGTHTTLPKFDDALFKVLLGATPTEGFEQGLRVPCLGFWGTIFEEFSFLKEL